MNTISAVSLKTGARNEYLVPTADEAIRYANLTFGVQFDAVERRKITGSIPMQWVRA